MQSSFVDIGLERDAFLYVSEVVNTVEEFERLESGDDEDAEPAEPPVPPVAAIEGEGEAAAGAPAANGGERRGPGVSPNTSSCAASTACTNSCPSSISAPGAVT